MASKLSLGTHALPVTLNTQSLTTKISNVRRNPTSVPDFCSSINNNNSVSLVRERTIPTERPPLVGKASANFWGSSINTLYNEALSYFLVGQQELYHFAW
jgi:hypothetical protein